MGFKLRQLYQDYMSDWEQIKTKSETMAIDEKLFAITEHKYQENMIKPTECLTAQKAITIIRANIKSSQMELLKRKNEVLYEAKWDDTRNSLLSTR